MLGQLGRCIHFCMAVICILWFAAVAIAQPADPDPNQMIQQMLTDAKDLAGRSLPLREQLPGWKVAWELPANAPGAVGSEDAYWNQTIKNMGFAGVSESYARKMVDSVSAQIGAAGREEGLTPRDGIITLLMRVQGTDAPTAIKYLNGWETSATMLKQAGSKDNAGNDAAASQRANRVILDGFAAAYRGQSDDQLKALFARQASLIVKRTEMSYFKSNNWSGLAQARTEDELVKNGIWLGVVKIDLMIADKNRLGDPLDLDPANAAAVQSRLLQAVNSVSNSVSSAKERDIEKKLATAEDDVRREALQAEKKKLAEERAAAANITVKVETNQVKNLGNNCYYIRITGVSPENAGLQVGLYTGWIRKGEAMAEITLGGNFPQDDMDKEMAHFLAEMDARLNDYDSSLAGMLAIAPASGTEITSPPPPDTGSHSDPSAAVNLNPPRPPTVNNANNGPGPVTVQNPPVRPPPPGLDPIEYAMGMQSYNQSNFAEAQKLFDQALAQNPNNPKVLLMRGASKFYQNDLAGAMADYRATTEIDPTNAMAFKYWGFMELCVGDPKRAAAAADSALRITPDDADALLTRGQAAMAMNDAPLAERYFQAVRAKLPDRPATLYNEAAGALSRKEYLVAALQFQTVLWLDPTFNNAWYARATALEGAGKPKQAVRAFQQYLKGDSTSAWATAARREIDRLQRSP